MATINNLDDHSGGDMGVRRALREFTSYIEGLELRDLTPADRAALRSLLDELLRDTQDREGQA